MASRPTKLDIYDEALRMIGRKYKIEVDYYIKLAREDLWDDMAAFTALVLIKKDKKVDIDKFINEARHNLWEGYRDDIESQFGGD